MQPAPTTIRKLKSILVTLATAWIATWSNAQAAPKESTANPKVDFVRWTMVDINEGDRQGDGHVLQMPDGQIIVVDTGLTGKRLIPFLKGRAISQIDLLLISHAHRDHYGGLLPLIRAGIQVREVGFNVPARDACDSEQPWGCNWKEVEDLLGGLKEHKISIRRVRAGTRLYSKGKVSLEVLYVYDGLKSPVGKTDVNDTSQVLLLRSAGIRVLFTGDLNQRLGTWLADHGRNLKADVLKVPHHGAESCAPDSFFDRVAPRIAMVSGPKELWQSDRARRLRDYFSKKGIQVHVTGLEGDVTLDLHSGLTELAKLRPEHP